MEMLFFEIEGSYALSKLCLVLCCKWCAMAGDPVDLAKSFIFAS